MSVIRFGPFEFDTTSGELRRHGRIIRLRPQPAAVLACLTHRAGDLVTRDELHRVVWADGTHVNFNQGLNSCVKQVRRALRDGRATAYVETLPRRGYRFVEPVEVVTSSWAGALSDRITDLFMQDARAIRAADLHRGRADARARSRVLAAVQQAVVAALSTSPPEPPVGSRAPEPSARVSRELRSASR